MNHRMTFFEERDSFFHHLNPLTKLVLVLTNILVAFLCPWYWTAIVLFFIDVIPLSFLGRMGKTFAKALLRLLVPAVLFLFVMQAFFYPGGQEVIFRIWFLKVTVEAVRAGFLISTRILVMVSSFILFLLSTHPSILMSDLEHRGFPVVFAYVITSTLQIIPQMRLKMNMIVDAQRSRGMETEGKLKTRIRALVPLVRPLVFGSLVDVEERTIAIEARAFTCKRKKTSLVEIHDSTWEVVMRWVMAATCLGMIGWRIWLLFP